MRRGTYENKSPWLMQLKKKKTRTSLKKDIETEIAIIGGGIAGVCTAYFILRDTHKKVVLIEATKIAHGATGHNAGQMVSYFERPFKSIVAEFGLQMAARGQKDILSAWKLIEEIYQEVEPKAPFSQFIGFAGCTTYDQVVEHLENKYLRAQARIKVEEIFISEQAPYLKEINNKYRELYTIVSQQKIEELLRTKDTTYNAVFASKKGVLNSALFCEEIVHYMLKKYFSRLKIYEKTPIREVELYSKKSILKTEDKKKITAKKVVLCTNGFEKIILTNKQGKDIDKQYHEYVTGYVGYMAGYIQKTKEKPIAISYFPKQKKLFEDIYFYMTKREYEVTKNKNDMLVCVGGPEVILPEAKDYERKRPYFEKRKKEITAFIKKTLIESPSPLEYAFQWHGLMGYTANMLRAIGPHPLNKNLIYNLGCNGVGILPSIYGGYKIARIISDIKLQPSIFDVKSTS